MEKCYVRALLQGEKKSSNNMSPLEAGRPIGNDFNNPG